MVALLNSILGLEKNESQKIKDVTIKYLFFFTHNRNANTRPKKEKQYKYFII